MTTEETAIPLPAQAQSRRAIWFGAARSGSARLLVLPISAGLGILVTRLIVDNYGTAAFAQYGLLVAIGALLPFADLGMGAAVINTVAASDAPAQDEPLRRVLITAIRVLLGSAVVLGLVAVALTLFGLWPAILGPGLLPDSGPVVAMVCLLLIAAAMPLGIGQRIMTGLRQNHLTIVVGGLQTPLVLAILLVALWMGADAGPVVAVFAYASTFLLALVIAVLAARRVRPLLRRALADVPRVRSVRGGRVMDVAWPMLVQMVALPIAMQTDRIVLSHRGGVDALAEYNLAAQMFTPIWGVVSAAGVTLWPVFARARARGGSDSPVPMSWVFGGVAAVMAIAVAGLSPFLAELASGGRIELGGLLVVSFTVFMVLQGLKYPLGMFMTDAAGLRFQALMIVLMLPINVALSWVLADRVGAAGPVIGSIVGVALFQVVANHLYVRRRMQAAEAQA